MAAMACMMVIMLLLCGCDRDFWGIAQPLCMESKKRATGNTSRVTCSVKVTTYGRTGVNFLSGGMRNVFFSSSFYGCHAWRRCIRLFCGRSRGFWRITAERRVA